MFFCKKTSLCVAVPTGTHGVISIVTHIVTRPVIFNSDARVTHGPCSKLVTSGDKFFHPFLKHASPQKNPSLAFEALKADVGARPHYLPLVAAAGVHLAQPDYVTDLYVYGH